MQNIRPARTNALAFHNTELFTAVKSLVMQFPRIECTSILFSGLDLLSRRHDTQNNGSIFNKLFFCHPFLSPEAVFLVVCDPSMNELWVT